MPKVPTPKQLLNLQAQHEQPSKMAAGGVVLAIDYGEKYCGLAVAPDGMTVLPVGVSQTEYLKPKLQELLGQYQGQVLVLGLPLSSDGSENHVCEQIRDLAAELKTLYPEKMVELVNERGSSQAALSPDESRLDDLAAAHILEFYLSKRH